MFAPVFEAFTPYDSSHKIRKLDCRTYPKSIHDVDGLGLQLFYQRNHGVQWVLSTVFGMTQSQVSNYLRFYRRILIKLLVKTNLAKASVPDFTDIESFLEVVSRRHPILGEKKVWKTMDELKKLLQQSGRFTLQLRYYNGWIHDHYVTNLFVFAPDGTIRFFVSIV